MTVTYFPQECPDCNKPFRGRKCPSCGFEPAKAEAKYRAERCPVDGGEIHTSGPTKGFCLKGGGYPVTMSCPFACPECGHTLEWAGGCFGCHGAKSGDRGAWTFPGEAYYTHDFEGNAVGDGLHYVRVPIDGTRPSSSIAENIARAKRITSMVGTPFPAAT